MQKPKECNGCSLANKGLGFSRPEGRGSNGVLAVGESLGWDEYIDGLPFRPHAQAGGALQRAFNLADVERHDFKLWNIIACHPPNNKVEGAEYGQTAIEHCKVHFQKVLGDHISNCNRANHTPVILTLGNLPLKVLTGVSGDPKEKQSISNLRGYCLPARDYQGVWVIGGYHPSFIRRGNANLYPALMDDIAKAIEVANGGFDWFKGGKGYKEPTYQLHPSLLEAEAFAQRVIDNGNLLLGMDIETPTTGEADEDEREEIEHQDIILFQFSLGKREGIAIPFQEPYLKVIQRICLARNVKLGFNWWDFDEPRVRAANIRVEGQVHDLMVMFSKYSPGLRKNLQNVASYCRFPFPWKHLYGVNLEWYGCADVDALHWIWEWLPGQMKEIGTWDCYKTQVYEYKTMLDRASGVGIPVDEPARRNLEVEVLRESEDTLAALETLIPISTRAVTPKRKDRETGRVEEGYKKPPKQLVGLLVKYKALKERFEAEGKKVVDFHKFALRHGYVKRERWCKLMPLKVSKEQLFRYIKWKKAELLKGE